jgi:hypothetical protein
MKKNRLIFKKLFAIFFLLVLFFPLVEKSFHELNHLDDFHCTDKSVLHFHQSEHSCSLCDYQVSPGVEPIGNLFAGGRSESNFSFLKTEIRFPEFSYFISLPARAPPCA